MSDMLNILSDDFLGTATYDPEDNKLRMYPEFRLDKEDYDRMRSEGFRWAPKQELFVAPMWTPGRNDLLVEFCGEIGDEDTSLVDRAEIRAERFEDYSDKRAKDAESAHEYVKSITDHIPLGQPILVGHHSEKQARKDAERIENGMRKAVKMWETSKYWEYRAAGALSAAKYKERPEVRARRIKKIGADKRRQERTKAESEKFLKAWSHEPMTKELSLAICNYDWDSSAYPLADYPREDHKYEGAIGVGSAIEYGILTPEQGRDRKIAGHKRNIARCIRWIEHYDNRLLYETAMLGEQGKLSLLDKPKRPKQLPLLNYRAPDGIQVENMYHRGEFSLYPQIEMTKEEYKDAYSKGTGTIDGTHRVRMVYRGFASKGTAAVFLADAKTHKKPDQVKKVETPVVDKIHHSSRGYTPPARTKFDDMKDSLREGVKVVVAPQLFPTPPDIAERMVRLADIGEGLDVLEPSAGTGNLMSAIWMSGYRANITAVEVNFDLHKRLKSICTTETNVYADFLQCGGELGEFDRIVMNPPFKNGDDIKHINHALTFLRPGGRLVALCANGPRQKAAFMDIAEHWEDLPADSFKDVGTRVNVALMVLTA